jgi:hypothetical protein
MYLIIINIKTLFRVTREESSDNRDIINDARYYELNNKIQLLTVVSSIIILIGGFLGYNSIDSIRGDIEEEMEVKLDEYVNKLKGYDTIMYKYNGLISSLEKERDTTFLSLINTKSETEGTKKDLIKLQKDYRLNAKTFFVKDVKINQGSFTDKIQTSRIYFKDLRELNSSLPEVFIKEPFITVVGIGDGLLTIREITREYFEYSFGGYTDFSTVLYEIFTELSLDSMSKDEKHIASTLMSLLKRHVEIIPPNYERPVAQTFDLIIVEGIND